MTPINVMGEFVVSVIDITTAEFADWFAAVTVTPVTFKPFDDAAPAVPAALTSRLEAQMSAHATGFSILTI